MNFLAHITLSEDDPEIMAGNLLADFIKGRQIDALTPAMRAGVRFHRKVDVYTDSHPVVKRAMRRFGSDWSRFSGILVDVVFDHYLANGWEHYSDESLRDFLNARYPILLSTTRVMPGPLCRPLRGIVQSDRMYSYRSLSGIEEALVRISNILSSGHRTIRLEQAMPLIPEIDGDLRLDFEEFFEEIREASREWRTSDQGVC